MTDIFSSEKRKWIMSRIKDRDTRAEMVVRSSLFSMGYRFRLHRKDLPGHPDIVLPRHEKVIFVHGCFWHGHQGCTRSKRPSSNVDFWNKKLDQNQERDTRFYEALKRLGWHILIVWECETKNPQMLQSKLKGFLENKHWNES